MLVLNALFRVEIKNFKTGIRPGVLQPRVSLRRKTFHIAEYRTLEELLSGVTFLRNLAPSECEILQRSHVDSPRSRSDTGHREWCCQEGSRALKGKPIYFWGRKNLPFKFLSYLNVLKFRLFLQNICVEVPTLNIDVVRTGFKNKGKCSAENPSPERRNPVQSLIDVSYKLMGKVPFDFNQLRKSKKYIFSSHWFTQKSVRYNTLRI
jgi:hypothetical protein